MAITPRAAALTVAGVLTADGLLHVLWSTGSTWPAGDARALSYAVLGIDAPFTPPVVLPLAAVLFGGAALVTARARLGRTHRLGRLFQAGTLAVACGTALRGIAGLGWAVGWGTGLDPAAGDTFQLLNRGLYTPLCLLLAAAALRVAAGRDSATALQEPAGKEAAAPRTAAGKEAAARAR
ncbi:DUF3995 domain-containing protein [Streptomyces sp. SID9727]|uniref:DUF3995 domain-containing protein n=1 Tax=Streptomyces sp. SID9727 TaxID=2706114 RepID=UPI0013CB0E66|nr:DUF3995 domain-containing protein [Streptomyces sp. SID9727]NEC65242.1 DUF3995 domain-containing protein [Streptomyces sp. SID9727]